jgi:hypothetical protein
LWGRPYQAGQLFNTDGDTGLPLKEYASRIAETLGDVEAYPPIFARSFQGVHIVCFTVDAPSPMLGKGAAAGLAEGHLECSYHFTTNGSAAIEVIPSPADSNSVMVIVSLNSVGYPELPEPGRSFETLSIKDLLAQAPSGTDIGWLEELWLDIKADVKVRHFDAPQMPDHEAGGNVVPFTAIDSLPPSTITTDVAQPFPIYGWLKVKWVHAGVAIGRVGLVASISKNLQR